MSWRYEYTKHIVGHPVVDGGQCVRLVQHFIPEIDNTKTWEKGERVIKWKGLVRGMAIANFDSAGNWPGKDHGNHAALLWDWGGRHMDTGLADWIEVVEQWVGLATIQVRRLKVEKAGTNVSNNAGEFYIIEHKGKSHEDHASRHGPPNKHFRGDMCPDRNEGEAMPDEPIVRSYRQPRSSR